MDVQVKINLRAQAIAVNGLLGRAACVDKEQWKRTQKRTPRWGGSYFRPLKVNFIAGLISLCTQYQFASPSVADVHT